MRVRLIATDLDGTLLRSDGSLSERSRAALKAARQAGLELICVTGRPPRRVREVAHDAGLSGLCICSNGALIYDLASESVVSQTRLSAAVAHALVRGLRDAAPGVSFAVEAGLDYGRELDYAVYDQIDRVSDEMRRDDAIALSAEGVTKLLVQHPELSHEELLAITSRIAAEAAVVTHSTTQMVEVSAAGVTKSMALAQLCQERSIGQDEVIAFGDMPNDLPMLRWAGHAVAVANAHPEVRAAADEIAGTNDEDGVADVLARLARNGWTVESRERPR
jgi:Cof subfamily protein (haloacid dehalogenase superfamily)